MNQSRPIPNLGGPCRPFVQNAPDFPVGGIGAGQRDDTIQHRPGVDDVADASQHPIDLSKSAKTIDVNRNKRGCLGYQLFVGHGSLPRWATYDNIATVSYLADAEKNIFAAEQIAGQRS